MLQFTLSAARSDRWPVTTHIGLLARNNSHRSDCWPVTTPTIYPARQAPVRRRCLASRASVLLSALRAPPLPPLYPLLLLLLSPPLTSVTPRPPGLATPAPPATALRSLLLPHHPPPHIIIVLTTSPCSPIVRPFLVFTAPVPAWFGAAPLSPPRSPPCHRYLSPRRLSRRRVPWAPVLRCISLSASPSLDSLNTVLVR